MKAPPALAKRERTSWFDWLVVALFAASVPVVAYGALNVASDTSDVTRWLPAGSAERSRYDWFVSNFGIDDFVIVSWDGCVADDPRLARFAAAVRAELATETSGRAPFVARVVTTGELLDRLESPPLALPRDEARRRIEGVMLGRETDTAAVTIEATPTGKRENGALVDALHRLAEESNIDPETLYLGGSIFEAVAIDRESMASLKSFVVPSGVAVLLLALVCVRDARLVLIMLLVSVQCQALSVAVLYFGGATLDAVLMVMPTLVYVTTMSGALHLVNYFRSAVDAGQRDPAGWTLRHGWKPCAGANLTTAIGLASLLLSKVSPVRLFGLYSAINVMVSLVVMLLVVPSALRFVQRWAPLRPRPARSVAHSLSRRYTDWVVRRNAPILALCTLAVVAASLGISRLETTLNLQHMFPEKSQLVRNYGWLERQVGPLIPLEIVVAFRKEANINLLTQLEVVEAVERRARDMSEIEAAMSAMTFIPPWPNDTSLRSVTHRIMFRRRLEQNLDGLRGDRMYGDDGANSLWRIAARVSALAGHEYGALVDRARGQVLGVLAEFPQEVRDNATIEFTGLTPVIYRAQKQMLSDLFNSFLGAFVAICPLMMMHLGGVKAGLVAMIPNVAPVALVFGMLGWLGVSIDIGVVLTASVGLGIAVDGTLHFVGWYRDCRQRGLDRDSALRSAFGTCAAAMTQTTLICGLGLMVFAASDFIPTARFAWLLMSLLLVALVADLLLMPALLAGPTGGLFDPKFAKRRATAPSAASLDATLPHGTAGA